ncbi:MAG: hypothetical protein SOT71_08130 [Romboutsia timonensis]|uniref:hypothetical protein n=1 Tax=Romboutsia timonensis TaxID=1776391 RepID=UPI002A74C9C0|nr:hypothetical protein [Romboutsia timonensis]MDY2882606.1 hypothetical protein [Romboutsia timonensis]
MKKSINILNKSSLNNFFSKKFRNVNFAIAIPNKMHPRKDLYNNLTYSQLFRYWNNRHGLIPKFKEILRNDENFRNNLKSAIIESFSKDVSPQDMGKETLKLFRKFFINEQHNETLSDSGFYWRKHYNKVTKSDLNLMNPKFAFTGATIDSAHIVKAKSRRKSK